MLSVIVPVYNDAKYLERCLASIFNSDYHDFEVIVVNDKSTDNSLDIAKKFPCRIIDLETNKGVANARNKGVEFAKGDILIFFDSDVLLEPDTLLRFAKAHENSDVKIYQCQIHHESLNPGFTSQLLAIIHNYLLSLMVPDSSYIQSFAFSINKSVFLEIGGFNTAFSSAGGEEFEIGPIITQHGYKMLIDQSFYVRHHFQSFWPRFKKLLKRSYLYGRIVLQRNFKLDKGYGTLRDGINSMISVFGLFLLVISLFMPSVIFIFFATIVIQCLIDFRLDAHIFKKKGVFFLIRSIPVIYLWYLSMGLGVMRAGLIYYFEKISDLLKTFDFLFSRIPPYVIFFVTDRCNARCKHCFNWDKIRDSKSADELSLEEIEKISSRFGRIKYMTYGGGEPSMREDIVDITKIFYNNNHLERLNFITNGFASEAIVRYVKRMLRACPGLRLTLSFSIDGIGEQHDVIRNTPGGFKNLLKSIDEIKKIQEYYPNLKILATIVYSSFNQSNIFDIIRYVTKELKLEMVLSYIRGDPFDKKAIDVDVDTYIKASEMLMNINAVNARRPDLIRAIDNLCFKLIAKTKIAKKSLISCVAGKKLIEIRSDGTIFPCETLNVNFDSIRNYNYDIQKVLKSKKARDFSSFLKKRECFCTWECAMKNNIAYSLPRYPILFFEWFKQFVSISQNLLK